MRHLLLALLLAGCRDDVDRVRHDVEMLVLTQGEQVSPAADRVAAHGRRSLVSIESALHTADGRGRKNLLLAVRRLGDGDAVPLLRHVAVFDEDPEVRREAAWTLQQWAAGRDAKGERARNALREIDERRGREGAG